LWKKEKDEFDKGMLKVKAVLEDAYKDADRAMKTLAYNRQEAEALANQSAAKLGGQVGKQILAKQGAVAILWGNSAAELAKFIPDDRLIQSVHPSPLSAYRGFFGSKPFSRSNEKLRKLGIIEMEWKI
jgi:uracil-DNA glycosylase